MKRLLIIFLLFMCSCAVLSKKNRYTLDFLDNNLSPESTEAQFALAPVAIPLGLTAFVVDGFLIHPIYSLPCAADDSFWVFREVPNTYIAEIIVFPMRIVTMVVTFVGSEIVRTTIPMHLGCKL